VAFVVCRPADVADAAALGLPMLVLGGPPAAALPPEGPALLGWIE
jgi:hypothetical protein